MALTADPPSLQPVPPAPRRRRAALHRRRLVVAGAVVAGALGFVLFEGLTNATEYFLTANQAVAKRAQLGRAAFRIEGTVLNDVRRLGDTIRFSIYADGATVPVVETGSPSQLFRPGIAVVLDGHWQGSYFASDQIMVKHSASYVEAHPNRVKPQLPPAARAEPGR